MGWEAETNTYKKSKIMNKQEQHIQALTEVFLNNINHEIRTPVNAIMGFSELVKTTEDAERRDHFLDIIMNNSRQLVRFVDNLIYLSQIQAGVVYPEYNPVSINELLNRIFQNAVEDHHKIHNGTLQLLMKEPPKDEDWQVELDETMITCIFHHLLNNAVQFTNSGYIKFGFQGKEGDMLSFFVADTGQGISASRKNYLLNKCKNGWFSVDNTDDSMGCGMGLTICKSLCDLMGGSIDFESEEGEGTTFYFRLPFRSVRKEGSYKLSAAERKEVLPGSAVLVVEDDESSLLYLQEVIEEAGMSSYMATTALEGLEFVKKKPDINFVLMDIQLPDMNGWKASRLVKEMRQDLPLVVQTGYSFHPPQNMDKSACDDFLLKPVAAETLLDKMAFYLQKGVEEAK